MIKFVCLLSVFLSVSMGAGAVFVSWSISAGLAQCRCLTDIYRMNNHQWFIIVQITTALICLLFTTLLPLILVIPPEITQITCLIPSFLKGFHTLGCQSSLIEAYLVQFPHQLLIWHDFGVWSSSRLSVTGSFGFCCWYPTLDTWDHMESGER